MREDFIQASKIVELKIDYLKHEIENLKVFGEKYQYKIEKYEEKIAILRKASYILID